MPDANAITAAASGNLAPATPFLGVAAAGGNLGPTAPGLVVIPIGQTGILVSGMVTPADANGLYALVAIVGGYGVFTKGSYLIDWFAAKWNVTKDLGSGLFDRYLESPEDVASPELVTTWTILGGSAVSPVFSLLTGDGGGNLAPSSPFLATAAAGGNLSPTAPGAIR